MNKKGKQRYYIESDMIPTKPMTHEYDHGLNDTYIDSTDIVLNTEKLKRNRHKTKHKKNYPRETFRKKCGVVEYFN